MALELNTRTASVKAAARVFDTVALFLASTAVSVAEGAVWRAGQFEYVEASASEARPHVTTAGGVKFFCTPMNGSITVKQVGGVEGGNITTALQNAIMIASFGDSTNRLGGEVLVDVNVGTLDDTIHVVYGCDLVGNTTFRGVKVRGLGRPFATSDANAGTRLTTSVTDRPAFVIQNGRFAEISDLAIIGPARDEIDGLDASGWGIRQAATWDTALTAAGITPNRRYAPHAAIAIDPYSGPKPATAYPDVTFHSWFTGTSQYGYTGGSTSTALKNLAIDGFEVGVVQQPGNLSANSDFLLTDCVDFNNTKWADSIGSSQSRNTTRKNCTYNTVWCLTTNNQHGQQIGTASGSFNNCSGAGFVGNLFHLGSLATGGGLSFHDLDTESVWKIGHIESATSVDTPLRLNNCQIEFSHNLHDIHPGSVITGAPGGVVELNSCNLQGFDSVTSFANLPRVLLSKTRFNAAGTPAKDYEKIAHNALAGGFVQNALRIYEQGIIFEPWQIGGSLGGTYFTDQHLDASGREYCCPISAGRVVHSHINYARSLTEMPRPTVFRSRTTNTEFTISSQVERVITLDMSTEFSAEDRVFRYGYLPGDVVVHEASGTVMFIRSVDNSGASGSEFSGGTGAVILELQNNYRDNSGTYEVIDDSFMDNGEVWQFFNSRIYAAGSPIVGSISDSSPNISVFSTPNDDADYGLAVGDRFLFGQQDVEVFAEGNAEVTAISAGTITMDGNAEQTIPIMRFDWWIRQPPANESSR